MVDKKVQYKVNRREMSSILSNIEARKSSKIKLKTRPKRFKKYVGKIAKLTLKRAIKNQLKKPINKAKKHLK